MIALLSRLRDARHLALLGFFAFVLIALLGVLHITEYRVIIGGSGQFLQARYLLPVVSVLGLGIGLIVGAIPRRAQSTACGVVLIWLLAFQCISLATVVQAYYV